MRNGHKITFGDLGSDGKLKNVRMISQDAIKKCPHFILMPNHYRHDGTCRCDDVDHDEMQAWGYAWDGTFWQAEPEVDDG